MFKLFSNIIISFILLITTTGFSISEHYCESRLVSVSINHIPDPCCGNDSNCCSNDTEYLQLKTDLNIPATLIKISISPESIILFEYKNIDHIQRSISIINSSLLSKSLSPPGEILLKIQSFLL